MAGLARAAAGLAAGIAPLLDEGEKELLKCFDPAENTRTQAWARKQIVSRVGLVRCPQAEEVALAWLCIGLPGFGEQALPGGIGSGLRFTTSCSSFLGGGSLSKGSGSCRSLCPCAYWHILPYGQAPNSVQCTQSSVL